MTSPLAAASEAFSRPSLLVALLPFLGAALLLLWIAWSSHRQASPRSRGYNSFLGHQHCAPAVVHGAVTAWKLASVGLDEEGRLRFAGVSHQDPYAPDADAVCVHSDHSAPQPDCTCGFYAYRSRSDAAEHAEGSFALLRVALSGEFVEYDRGWRTGHQRVELVELRGGCSSCDQPGVALRVLGWDTPRPGMPRGLFLICRGCLRSAVRAGWGIHILSHQELLELLRAGLPAGRPAELRTPHAMLSHEEVVRLRTPISTRVLTRGIQITRQLRAGLAARGASTPSR